MTFEERDDRRTNALGLMEDGRKEEWREESEEHSTKKRWKKEEEGRAERREKKFGTKAPFTLPHLWRECNLTVFGASDFV